MMRKAILSTALLAAIVVVPTANADIFLNDLNTSIRFSQDQNGKITGMDDWIVDGVEHLYTQWFWFRVGVAGPEMGLEVLDQTINAVTAKYLDVTFTDPAGQFAIDVTYSLTAGTAGSGLSDVAEQIRVRNLGRLSLDMHFFQYSDFDLNGTIGDDTVVLDGFSTARVFDGGVELSETVLTPAASHREAGVFPGTVNKLNDGNPDDLNDVGGPLSGVDATWAFQWDRLIGVGGSFLISKDKSIQTVIPAPGAALLGVLGLSLVGYIKRRFS